MRNTTSRLCYRRHGIRRPSADHSAAGSGAMKSRRWSGRARRRSFRRAARQFPATLWTANPMPQRSRRPIPSCNWLASRIPARRRRQSSAASIWPRAGARSRPPRSAGVQHFVYISVAHPAPMMKAYIEVRSQCEAMIRQSGMNATILRPWYVLGPGHRWPYLLLPIV